jgi:hypothetical protein
MGGRKKGTFDTGKKWFTGFQTGLVFIGVRICMRNSTAVVVH